MDPVKGGRPIEAVVLTPEDGTLKINLRGDIAHILALASERNKPAALGDGLVEQLKLVAGAGFVQVRTDFELRRTA